MRALLILALVAGAPALAEQSLESQASDPTAALMSFQFQNFYTPNLHNSTGSRNAAQFRAAIPFQLGGLNNIARLTLPLTPGGFPIWCWIRTSWTATSPSDRTTT